MTEDNFLPLFLTEELYLIHDSAKATDEKITVIVENPLTEADQQFLYKIFAAVSKDAEQLMIQAAPYTPGTKGEVFYFGDTPESGDLELYQVHSQGDLHQVYCHSLKDLADDQQLKRKLWGILKELYA